MPLNPVPNYPTSLDSLPDPTNAIYEDDDGFEIDLILQKHNAILEALEGKAGTGASTATANTVLRGTGAGATAFGQLVAADVTAGALPTLLATTGLLGAAASAWAVSSISQAYSSLELRFSGRSTASVTVEGVRLTVNGVVTASYWNQQLYGQAAVAGGVEALGQTSAEVGLIPGASSSDVGWVGSGTLWIHGYTSTTRYKGLHAVNYGLWNSSTNTQQTVVRGALLGNAGAITSLSIGPATGQWDTDSILSLYGWP
jgi:hypothetical protein